MKNILPTLLAAVLLALASPAPAAEPKRVIVCTVTTGFRHSSIEIAEKALQKMADTTKDFTIVEYARQPQIVVPRKPNKPRALEATADEKARARYASDMAKYEAELAKWTPDFEKEVKDVQAKFTTAVKASLAVLDPKHLVAEKIDGVIFASTTGELPLPDNEGFLAWIKAGHAFIGIHSASDTFHQLEGYKQLLQGEFKQHGKQVAADLVAGDAPHPAAGGLGEKWTLAQEEMYEFRNGSHDRSKTREIWFLRHPPQEPAVAQFAAVSWVRQEETGRVFYTSLGHREDLWSDDPALPGRVNSPEISRQFQAHILGGVRWALGLAEGSAEPNPAVN